MRSHILTISLSLLAGASLLMTGCADDSLLSGSATGAKERTFTLLLPGFSDKTRALDENAVNSLYIIFLDDAGGSTGDQTLTPSDIAENGNGYTVTLAVPDGSASVKVIANGNTTGEDRWILTDNPDRRDDMVFYGTASLAGLEDANPCINMIRACAKTEVSVEADGFELKGIRFYGQPDRGATEAPDDLSAPNLPAGITYSGTGVSLTTSAPFYHYEAEAGRCYLIIHGIWEGIEGYYKAAYIPRDTDDDSATAAQEVPLIRNHRYIFNVTGINSTGWATEEEARQAPPDNRMTVMLKDDCEAIYDMVACRDYYLGVGNAVTAEATDESVLIHIVTSYEGDPLYSLVISPEDESWITGYTPVSVSDISADDTHTAGKEITLRLSLTQNSLSSEPRTGTVTILSGDLSRTVAVTQGGWDYLRDPSRRVMLYNLAGSPAPVDYYDFIDNTLQGATAAYMQTARDNHLHFSVYGNRYYYTIPKKDGDSVTILSGGERFNVTDTGSDWKVECTAHRDYEMWEGSFLLSNSVTNARVEYDVCHVGMFHQIPAQLSPYVTPGPDGTSVSGWYYYEQVQVTGTDGETYYVLDRNMGATSNRPYNPSGVATAMNTGARGGYFIISRFKSDNTLINLLPPPGYEIPNAYHMTHLGARTVNQTEGTAGIKTTAGAFPWIYIPVAGTMDGDVHSDQSDASLWTSTLLSGNQGFSETSPEYGLWYRYLDIYGTLSTVKNMRIGTSSSDGSISKFRTMPVRCIHPVKAAPLGWAVPDPADGRRRIYVSVDSNLRWNYVYAWVWGSEENPNESFGLTAVTARELPLGRLEDGSLYCDIPEKALNIMFFNENYLKTQDFTVKSDSDRYHIFAGTTGVIVE